MMAGTLTLRVRRSRGALSGVLLVLLGIWGALIPFIGPYFNYAYTPARTWDVTAGRMWLEVLPGAVAFVCGVVVLISRLRPVAVLAAWLAALALLPRTGRHCRLRATQLAALPGWRWNRLASSPASA